MKKFVLALLIVLSLAVMPAFAQSKELVAGEPVEAEMTNEEFTFEYTYNGVRDEVIILRFTPTERYGVNSTAKDEHPQKSKRTILNLSLMFDF